jgi:hypothetical protein
MSVGVTSAQDLTVEELQGKSTQRLLAMYKGLRKDWQECSVRYDDGFPDKSYFDHLESITAQMLCIKDILSTREHVERKTKKRRH